MTFGTERAILSLLRLSSRRPAARRFARSSSYLERFGTLDRLYLLFEVEPNRPISDHDAFIDAYVERLREAPEIQSVDASPVEPASGRTCVDRALLFLPSERWPEARARFEAEGMKSELERSRDMLSLPSPRVKALVQNDPLRLLPLLREQLSSLSAGLTVSPDGASRLVLVSPKGPTFDVDFAE